MDNSIKTRLEYLRQELRAERISYGELAELQGLVKYIDDSDVELLEAAGVPEKRMTPYEAWLYAAQWGSAMRGGDPGACMYGFSEDFTMQSEEHRTDCLNWIDKECVPLVNENPELYDDDELEKLAALRFACVKAPCQPA